LRKFAQFFVLLSIGQKQIQIVKWPFEVGLQLFFWKLIWFPYLNRQVVWIVLIESFFIIATFAFNSTILRRALILELMVIEIAWNNCLRSLLTDFNLFELGVFLLVLNCQSSFIHVLVSVRSELSVSLMMGLLTLNF
jgi:hypothetical protein